MAWSGPATRKQSDKKMKKAAEAAQRWMVKGFTAEQAAEGIRNRVGYTTEAKDSTVIFYGHYNDEKTMRERCRITSTSIEGPY